LQLLGFDFVQVGPIVDRMEDINSQTTQQNTKDILYNNTENSIYIFNPRETHSLEYSLVKFQQKFINKNITTSLCYDLKLSQHSANNVPYMADNIFIGMVNTGMLVADFLTIDLSSYRSKVMVQYKNRQKFEGFLNKIKAEIYKEIGIKAAVQYELIEKPVNGIKVSSYYNIPSAVLNKKRTKLLFRLDPDLSDEDMKMQIDAIIKSEIVDGIIVGGLKVYEYVNIRKWGDILLQVRRLRISLWNCLRRLLHIRVGEFLL
jgi:hypothetical protein